ncbi:MAG: putative hydrolase superfamily [Parachlamydiales bacterium]|nr:putative hydrolase superfamily [Parachlamydiales bacterium]
MIVFDLDDTLIDTSGTITPYKLKEFLTFLVRRGIDVGDWENAIAEITQLDKQCVTSKDTVRFTLERYGAVHLYPAALALYSEPLPKDFRIPTTPHAKNVLEVLHSRGNRLALVTGGKKDYQLEKIEKAGLEPALFSKIMVPADMKKRSAYESLLKDFLVLPGDCVVVGDRIPMDLVPAHDLGFRTVHMRWGRGHLWKKEKWIERSISDLSELLEIL